MRIYACFCTYSSNKIIGKSIVAATSFYEVADACLKRRKVPPECEIEAIFRKEKETKDNSLEAKR